MLWFDEHNHPVEYEKLTAAGIWSDLADRARRILEIDDTCFVAQYRLANEFLNATTTGKAASRRMTG